MNTILMSLIMMTMTYEMPKLPYANNALEPVISQQTKMCIRDRFVIALVKQSHYYYPIKVHHIRQSIRQPAFLLLINPLKQTG